MLISFHYQQELKMSFSKKRSSTPAVIKAKYQALKNASYSKRAKGLYYALMTGDKRNLDKGTREQFKKMGLMHLLTPSGLHLSSLIVIIKLVPLHWQLLFLGFICLGFLLIEDYYAIKRVIIFKIITLVLQKLFHGKTNNHKGNHNKWAFLLTFLVDMLIGNFHQSPLSYIYSFLFWGTILFHSGGIFKLSYKL